MRRLIAASLLLTFCSLPAFAQGANPPPAPDPQKVALGRDIFDLYIAKQDFQARLRTIFQTVLQNRPANLPAGSNAPSQATMDAAAANIAQAIDDVMPKMRDAYADSYARHFSLEELQTIKSFYQSPAGVTLLSETPAIATEVMQSITPELMSRMRALMPKPAQSQPPATETKP
jgi:hypothetical protein